jgi:hypothetical protein
MLSLYRILLPLCDWKQSKACFLAGSLLFLGKHPTLDSRCPGFQHGHSHRFAVRTVDPINPVAERLGDLDIASVGLKPLLVHASCTYISHQ